ncbi:MAG: cysteine synthase family protein, partial [Clostridia bacterium]|nr:cysteine synthase family protein [Clostridia bacterium]
MGKIYTSVCQIIGKTPLLRLSRVEQSHGLGVTLLGKMEGLNPAGSAKDRVALSMVEAAERDGRLTPGAVILEPTSGNTGIGLAAVAASRGYRAMFVMPDTMSAERIRLLAAYGAEIVLTPGGEGMAGAIARAEELARELPNSFIPDQFANPDNPRAHYETIGPEIWADTDGQVDIFV